MHVRCDLVPTCMLDLSRALLSSISDVQPDPAGAILQAVSFVY
jgi:hypothetical protein